MKLPYTIGKNKNITFTNRGLHEENISKRIKEVKIHLFFFAL